MIENELGPAAKTLKINQMIFLYPIMGHFMHDSEIEYSSYNRSSNNLSIKEKLPIYWITKWHS